MRFLTKPRWHHIEIYPGRTERVYGRTLTGPAVITVHIALLIAVVAFAMWIGGIA